MLQDDNCGYWKLLGVDMSKEVEFYKKLLSGIFGSDAPKKDIDSEMTIEFIKDEFPTSPAYRDAVPTEKPLERVEAPWEMLVPTLRALKAIQLLKTGKAVKRMAEPASNKLMRSIQPAVQKSTGYKDSTVGAVLRDLNRKNPLSKRLFKEIEGIDLKSASPDKKKKIIKLMEELGYKGRIEKSGGVDPFQEWVDSLDLSSKSSLFD